MPDLETVGVRHLPSGEMAIVPSKVEESLRAADRALDSLFAKMDVGEFLASYAQPDNEYWGADSPFAVFRPYVVEGRTLRVPVSGLLMKSSVALGNYATGYEYIERAITRAEADDGVDQIALVVDSPGGYILGSEDAVAAIKGSGKPVTVFVKHMAASAAYLLASHASKIVATPGGVVGSIGVIATHVSMERALENAGLKVTLVYEGATKADGNPFKDLPEDALSRYKAQIKTAYSALVASVADGRDMEESDIAAMESRSYRGKEAREKGLVDEVVSSMRDAWAAYVKTEAVMPDKKAAGANGPENTDVLVAQNEKDKLEAVAKAKAAERERIKAIMQSDEAQGREAMAIEMAVNTDLPAEQAVALLAKSPKTEPAPAPSASEDTRAASHFEEAMTAEAGSPIGSAEGADDEAKPANPLLAAWSAATGVSLDDSGRAN